ncbi:MAG: triose-phosphate isomerase [Bacteroidales bacterium]
MRKKIVAGNWKMNTTFQEGQKLISNLLKREKDIPANVNLIIAPPFTHLSMASNELKNSKIALSAQNCAEIDKGARTGEISAAMLKSINCSYVIIGHSERRAYFGEKSKVLKNKINQAFANKLDIIFCIGETLDDRTAQRHFEVVHHQMEKVLWDLTPEQMAHIIIGYEPVWAIGTGETATPEQAQQMHTFIRTTLAGKFGNCVADDMTILYGGSCKPSNAKELFACPDIDGGLIGGAALNVDDFINISKSF